MLEPETQVNKQLTLINFQSENNLGYIFSGEWSCRDFRYGWFISTTGMAIYTSIRNENC